MAKKIILDPIWECETIPDMKFETEEDADKFDSVLRNYISNKEAISEFEKAESGFPSWAALWRQISIGEFHLKLEGKYSDELIAACETCFEVWGDCDHSDCYTPVMAYIFDHLHPDVVKLLLKEGHR